MRGLLLAALSKSVSSSAQSCLSQPIDYDLRAGDSGYWSGEGRLLVDTLISFQRISNGWEKNIHPVPGEVYNSSEERGCLDNDATVEEVRFMAQACKETSIARHRTLAQARHYYFPIPPFPSINLPFPSFHRRTASNLSFH